MAIGWERWQLRITLDVIANQNDPDNAMVSFTGLWNRDEVAVFLQELHVPVRIACTTPSGHLWMLSLWYQYDDDAIKCATSAAADVVRYLRHDTRVAFEISTNDPPYRGVRGHGQADIRPDRDKALLKDLLHRYLGGTDSSLAQSLLRDDRDEVSIVIEPRSVYSWDFTERMRER